MPSVRISGTTPYKDYNFTVKGRNPLGAGFPATVGPAQFNYNKATGGTETIEDDYWGDGSGERWTVHTFTSDGTLDVSMAPQPFRVALIGGGSGGSDGLWYMIGGNCGKISEDPALSIPVGPIAVSVGRGGGGGTNADGSGGANLGGAGGTSSVESLISAAGGAPRSASGGAVGADGRFNPGIPGPTTDYPGKTVRAGTGGTGGGDCGGGGCPGGAGQSGIGIIAYRTG